MATVQEKAEKITSSKRKVRKQTKQKEKEIVVSNES